jgi:hypothetical protein
MLPGLGLDTTARCVAAMLQPWQAIEPVPMRTASADEIATRVAAIRTYIPRRMKELATFVDASVPTLPTGAPCPAYGSREEEAAVAEPPQAEEPEEEVEEPEPEPEKPKDDEKPAVPAPGQPSPEAGPATATLVEPALPARLLQEEPLRLSLTVLTGRLLTTHVQAPEAGRLQLTATMGAEGRGPDVCSSETPVPVGFTPVSCRLDAGVRRSLAMHARTLTLSGALRTSAGTRLRYSRTVRLGKRQR